MGETTARALPRAYTVNGFCRAYNVGRTFTYGLIAAGKLPSVRVAGRRLIPTDGAEALIRTEAQS
jgi:excisionase family DNA binding protein